MSVSSGFVAIVKKVDSFFNLVSKGCFIFSAIIILATCLMILLGVINRTFIGAIWLFVEEYATFALLPMSYMVYGYVLRQDRHLKLDVIYNKMPYKVRIILAIFAGVVTFITCIFMLIAAFSFMSYQYDCHVVSTGGTRTPLWIISLTIVVGIALFGSDLIFYILNEIINLVAGEEPFQFKQKILEEIPNVIDTLETEEFIEATNVDVEAVETHEGGVNSNGI